MLMHLPIILLAAFPAAHAGDKVPTLDMARECRFEGNPLGNQQQCLTEEKRARQQLGQEWRQFTGDEKRQCLNEATMGGTQSYVELVTCLENARDMRIQRASNAQARTGNRRK